MKKQILSLLFLCACLSTQAQNLLVNGGFEDDFTRWNNISENGANGTFTIETATANVQEGTKAMKVVVATTGTNAWDVQSIHGGWTAEPGKAYTLTFYAKAEANGTRLTTVQQKTTYAQKEFTLTTEWQRYEWTFVPTEADLQLKVYFPSAGTVYLDNVSLMLLPDPADNLLLNGGFENDFVRWNNIAENGANGTFSIENSIVTEGSKAMKVVVTTPGSNHWDIQSIHGGWTAEIGRTYTMTFYAKAAASGGKITVVQQKNSFYAQKELDLTTEWQPYEFTFAPTEASLQMKVYFPVAGTYYLDNFVIPVTGTVTSNRSEILASNAVKVYPNPAVGGKFTLEVEDASLANATKVQVVNVQGAVVLEKEVNQKSVSFDQALSSGVYFVKVLNKGKVSVKRVVVL